MPREIRGIEYFSAAEVARGLGLSRQTLWRWRRDGKIPSGHRFRDGQIMFTQAEVDRIYEHANRLEPVDPSDANQLRLFDRV